ncbi:MAG TPA: diaminopimelate epimerase [Cyclobacteriaceae bacterium]|nr:diaminopimelate epimerase [Cyclobacteriaceae bacterium]
MKIRFTKYQATGNDFVLVDNRNGSIKLSVEDIQRICDRRFGVGADGLMMIEKHPKLDFNLVYYNADGSQSLCGNGSRAAMKMASSLGMVNGKATFNAFDGAHEGEIKGETVKVKMADVTVSNGTDFINTGSPHAIRFVSNLKDLNVFEEGKKIRYSDAFKPNGTNANFVELLPDNKIYVRTYERGVENETLSCGTGVTAAALAAYFKGYTSPVAIKTQGGDLSVQFMAEASGSPDSERSQSVTFRDIFLIGPAKMVFEGELDL